MIGSTNSIWNVNRPYEQLINYTMIYDLGDECNDITGGWGTGLARDGSGFTKVNANFNSNHVLLSISSGAKSTGIKTKSTVNLSDYSKLSALCYGYQTNSSGIEPAVGIGATENTNYFLGSTTYTPSPLVENIVKLSDETSSIWLTSDVSNINKNGYIAVHGWVSSYLKITTLYLEINSVVLTKEDDFQTLADLAGITAGNIDGVLINSTTLLSNKQAVEYMIKQCTGDFMVSAVANETFLTALNNSQYKTIIMANEHWAKFLNMVA